MIELDDQTKKALLVAEEAERLTISHLADINAQRRFHSLHILAAKVKELAGIAPTPPKTCHCRASWADFEMNRWYAFKFSEMEKSVEAMLKKIGRKNRLPGYSETPEIVVELLKEIEKKCHLAVIGATE